MNKQDQPVRDPFTFSLCGATTIASFTAVPAVANNMINKILDERFRQLDDKQINRKVTYKLCA